MNAVGWALARSARRQRADGSWWTVLLWVGAVAVAWVLVAPWFRREVLGFLDGGSDELAAGLGGLWMRAGLLMLAWGGLSAHGSVLRGASREVFSVLPVRPWDVVRAELIGRVAPLGANVAALAALAWPVVAVAGWGSWGAGLALTAGAGVLGLVAGAGAVLGAVVVAEDRRFDGLLDAVRGSNPRAQAAVIWSLAPGTLLGGLLVVQAADAVTTTPAWSLAPWVAAAALASLLPVVADRAWWTASLVLAEIADRYAAVEKADTTRHVYLDFVVRWLPAASAPWALLELRHAARERRSALWIPWVLAAVARMDQRLPPELPMVLIGAVGAWLMLRRSADTDPALSTWLGDHRTEVGMARIAVGLAWAVGPTLAGAILVGADAGPGEGLTAGAAGLAGAVVWSAAAALWLRRSA